MKEQNFEILASYFQIYFEDLSTLNSYGIIPWSENELKTMSFTSKHAIVLGTFRDSEVHVTMRELEGKPILDFEQFDHVVECGIDIISGTAVLYSLNDTKENYRNINLDKGVYGAFLCFAGASTIDELGITGNDTYTISLWKEDRLLPKTVLKQIE